MKKIIGSILAYMPTLTFIFSLIPGIGPEYHSDTETSGTDWDIILFLIVPVIGIVLMNLNVKRLKVLSRILKIFGGIILTFSLLTPMFFLLKQSWRFAIPIIPILTLIAGIAGIILLAIKKKNED